MDASNLPSGSSAENSPATNLPGIYKHEGTGGVIITQSGDAGAIMADGLMRPDWRGSWKRVGDVPSRVELLAMQKKQLVKDLAEEKKAKADDEAELAALVEAEMKATEVKPEAKK